jgi:deoxyinosine 3'endonuclease (endonuclease V)
VTPRRRTGGGSGSSHSSSDSSSPDTTRRPLDTGGDGIELDTDRIDTMAGRLDGGEEVGAALRTQAGVKPVFVSIGHLVDLPTACALVLKLAQKYRLPETTRQADHLSRATLKTTIQNP